jgi:N-acetylmuramic acid 6-phosphate (MurNAc-6-P) etherase
MRHITELDVVVGITASMWHCHLLVHGAIQAARGNAYTTIYISPSCPRSALASMPTQIFRLHRTSLNLSRFHPDLAGTVTKMVLNIPSSTGCHGAISRQSPTATVIDVAVTNKKLL